MRLITQFLVTLIIAVLSVIAGASSLRQGTQTADASMHAGMMLRTLDEADLQSVLDEKRGLSNLLKHHGTVSSITLPNSDGFNPSILPMPLGSSYPYWVVFRRESSKRDGNYNELVSCFLLQTDGGDLICGSSLTVLRDVQYNRTLTPFGNLGPEDPRIVFGLEGQPLLAYGNTSTTRDRGIWIRDLREAFRPHEFTDHFPVGFFDNVPLTIKHPTEFILPGSGWVKNIYPFNDFNENKMYLLDHSPEPEPSILPYDEITGNTTKGIQGRNGLACFKHWLGASEIHEIHGATNMLRLVFCNRNEDCEMTHDNVIRFGIVHHRHGIMKNYSPLVVTMDDYVPFNYRSISSTLYFRGSITFQYISSIQFVQTEDMSTAGMMEVGYLDSLVIISMGVDDERCATVVVPVVELLKDHFSCQSTTPTLTSLRSEPQSPILKTSSL